MTDRGRGSVVGGDIQWAGARPHTQSRTVWSGFAARIVDAAVARGVSADEVCTAVGLPRALVGDVDGRMPFDQYLDLWREVMHLVGAREFPLEAGAGEMPNLLHVLCTASETLGEALSRAARYAGTLTNAVSWSLETAGHVAMFRVVREGASRPEIAHVDEFSIAAFLALARRCTSPSLAPRLVCFAHAAPRDLRPHEAFFAAPLRFDCATTALHLRAEDLNLPLRRADPSVCAFMEQVAEKRLAVPPPSLSLGEQVRVRLRGRLAANAPSLEAIASELGTSPRTLRRHLQSDGVSFQQILDEARAAMAKRLLARGEMTIQEIAGQVGFSEPSAFYRAFRRWTGTTPQAFAPGGRRAVGP